MATIGSLHVKLSATSAAFESAIRKSTNSLDRFGKAASSALNMVSGLGAGLSVAGFVSMTRATQEAIEEQADFADRIGVSLTSLAAFEHAAKRANIATESVRTSVNHFARVLGNAEMGAEGAESALKMLGLRHEDLIRLPVDVALGKTFDAINALDNEYVKTSATMKFFGKSAGEMLTLIKDGSRGLEEARQLVIRLGAAPNPFEVEKIRAANDAVDDLSLAWRGLKNEIALLAAGPLTTVTSGITEALAQARANRNWKFGGFIEGPPQTIASVDRWTQIEKVAEAAEKLKKTGDIAFFTESLEKLDKQFATMQGGENALLRMAMATKTLTDAQRDQLQAAMRRNEMVKVNEAVSESVDNMLKQVNTLGMAAEQMKNWEIQMGVADDTLKSMHNDLTKELTLLQKITDVTDEGKGFLYDYALAMEDLQKSLKKGAISQEGFTRGMAKMKQSLKDFAKTEGLRVIADTMQPLEKFEEELRKLDFLQRKGTISADHHALALAKFIGELEQSTGVGKFQLPQAAEVGSREALSAAAQHGAQIPGDPQQRVAAVLEQIKILQQQQLDAARQIRRAIDENNAGGAADFF